MIPSYAASALSFLASNSSPSSAKEFGRNGAALPGKAQSVEDGISMKASLSSGGTELSRWNNRAAA